MPSQSIEERFWAKVRKTDGCWLWTGYRRSAKLDYGRFIVNGRVWNAHRVAWELTYGAIPAGLFVCHHCDNPPCVRPDHLFLGTHQDNQADRKNKGPRSTVCHAGHLRTIENTVWVSGRRRCKICDTNARHARRLRVKSV